jgi:hypothetical protein
MKVDDYWVYERLKQHAIRMELVPVCDIPRNQAVTALSRHRSASFDVQDAPELLSQVNQMRLNLIEMYDLVGGRLGFLSKVANKQDLTAEAE